MFNFCWRLRFLIQIPLVIATRISSNISLCLVRVGKGFLQIFSLTVEMTGIFCYFYAIIIEIIKTLMGTINVLFVFLKFTAIPAPNLIYDLIPFTISLSHGIPCARIVSCEMVKTQWVFAIYLNLPVFRHGYVPLVNVPTGYVITRIAHNTIVFK